MELTLAIDVWLPTGAGDKLKAHEEGHRQISEKVYAEVADKAAKFAADKLDGKKFDAYADTAADAEKAAKDALTTAHTAMIKAYLAETSTAGKKIQDKYDELTRHGANRLEESEAIKQAWAAHPPAMWVQPKAPATRPVQPATKPGDPATKPAARSDDSSRTIRVAGSGFVIAPEGLILTTSSVVDGIKSPLVLLPGAGPGGRDVQKPADVVLVDREQNLAVLRLKLDPNQVLPALKLSPLDAPPEESECTVVGFQNGQPGGPELKVSRGTVATSAAPAGPPELAGAKITAEHAGAPIVDRNGNVVAIVTIKPAGKPGENASLATNAGVIRKFLAKHQVKAVPTVTNRPALNGDDAVIRARGSTVCIVASQARK
jgi:hypothetical protein